MVLDPMRDAGEIRKKEQNNTRLQARRGKILAAWIKYVDSDVLGMVSKHNQKTKTPNKLAEGPQYFGLQGLPQEV